MVDPPGRAAPGGRKGKPHGARARISDRASKGACDLRQRPPRRDANRSQSPPGTARHLSHSGIQTRRGDRGASRVARRGALEDRFHHQLASPFRSLWRQPAIAQRDPTDSAPRMGGRPQRRADRKRLLRSARLRPRASGENDRRRARRLRRRLGGVHTHSGPYSRSSIAARPNRRR